MPDAHEIDPRLATYLGTLLSNVRILASGWETTVFEFALGSRCERLPEVAAGAPLVLRFYEGPNADEKAAREEVTLRQLAEAGYPVPRPYLFEPDHSALGAPFLIMERVTGGPLFSTESFPRAFRTFSLGFVAFVRAQARLHRMSADTLSPREGLQIGSTGAAEKSSLLDRILATIADRIERGPLPGLAAACSRLQERAAPFRDAATSILHMDYHPQNVIVRGMRVTGVIDWVNANRGDRHLCAATTAVILASSAMERPRWMRDNTAGNSLRTLFTSLYLPLYHALAPMEMPRFRYCQGVAALLRLSMFGMMRARGAEAVGFRPEAIGNVTPSVVRLLSRYASRKCGVPVSIESR